jgi:hypothetical protein
MQHPEQEFAIFASMHEVYNENLRDLLQEAKTDTEERVKTTFKRAVSRQLVSQKVEIAFNG